MLGESILFNCKRTHLEPRFSLVFLFIFNLLFLMVLIDQAITAGILVGFSDAVAQKISGIKRLQLRRLLLIMVYNLTFIFHLKLDHHTIILLLWLKFLVSLHMQINCFFCSFMDLHIVDPLAIFFIN